MTASQQTPKKSWNRGRIIGPKPPLKPKHIWAIRTRLAHDGQVRDLAVLNVAIDSKLRGCDLAVCRAEPGPLRAAGDLVVAAEGGLDLLDEADLVVVPGWRDIDAVVPMPLVDALRRANARGARVMSLCSGVVVLAEAGLLDGRRATTHWRYVDAVARRHPAIRFDPDVLYVVSAR